MNIQTVLFLTFLDLLLTYVGVPLVVTDDIPGYYSPQDLKPEEFWIYVRHIIIATFRRWIVLVIFAHIVKQIYTFLVTGIVTTLILFFLGVIICTGTSIALSTGVVGPFSLTEHILNGVQYVSCLFLSSWILLSFYDILMTLYSVEGLISLICLWILLFASNSSAVILEHIYEGKKNQLASHLLSNQFWCFDDDTQSVEIGGFGEGCKNRNIKV